MKSILTAKLVCQALTTKINENLYQLKKVMKIWKKRKNRLQGLQIRINKIC